MQNTGIDWESFNRGCICALIITALFRRQVAAKSSGLCLKWRQRRIVLGLPSSPGRWFSWNGASNTVPVTVMEKRLWDAFTYSVYWRTAEARMYFTKTTPFPEPVSSNWETSLSTQWGNPAILWWKQDANFDISSGRVCVFATTSFLCNCASQTSRHQVLA